MECTHTQTEPQCILSSRRLGLGTLSNNDQVNGMAIVPRVVT